MHRVQKFIVVLSLLLLIVPLSLLMIRTVKASGDWHQPVSYFSDLLLSNNSGTYVGNCVADRSEFVGSSYAVSGNLNWSIPSTSNPLPCPSQQVAAIGADGAIYTDAITLQPNDWTEHITKYVNGQVVWDTVPPHAQSILALSLGTDGNVYMITDSTANTGGSISLLGLSSVLTAGATTPQVILDKPLGVLASSFYGFGVYKDGLVVSLPSNGAGGESLQYFGYDGSTQASVTISNPGPADSFTATLNGRVFVPQVSITTSQCTPDPTGYPDESSVLAYGPTGQQWSYALPSCSVVYGVRPTPDGGVVLWINNNGNTQYLLSVKGDGTTRWPNPVSIGGSSGGISYTLDALYVTTAGDVATVEDYTLTDNNKGVIIALDSGGDGSQLWVRNFVPSASQGGYTYADGGNPSFALAHGMAYILITHCMYSTNGGVPGCGGQTLYGLNAPSMELDYPRGAILQGTPTPRVLNYVAMGDSFSSGEGNPPFITGPGYNTAKDGCHRSVAAYPALLGRTTTLHLKLTFVACSGASSAKIIKGWNGEPSQINAITSSTDVVTLTTGGDDIGFADYAKHCLFVFGGCDSGTSIYHTTLNNITNKLPTSLNTLYQAIKTRIAKVGAKVTVFVVGYPVMLSSFSFPSDCNLLTPASVGAAEYITAKLNLAIMHAVSQAGAPFVWVSATKPSSPFYGHPLCSSDSYFNNIKYPVIYSFHPNALGQQAYAEIVKPYIG